MPWKLEIFYIVAWVAMMSTYSFFMGRRHFLLSRMKVHLMQENEKSVIAARVESFYKRPSTSPYRRALSISSKT